MIARGTHTELLATVPGYADLVTAYEQAEVERREQRTYDDEVTPPPASGLEIEVDR